MVSNGAADRVLRALEEDLHTGRHDRLDPHARSRGGAGTVGTTARRCRPVAPVMALREQGGAHRRLVQAAQAGLCDARAILTAPQGFASYDAHGRAGQIAPAARARRAPPLIRAAFH